MNTQFLNPQFETTIQIHFAHPPNMRTFKLKPQTMKLIKKIIKLRNAVKDQQKVYRGLSLSRMDSKSSSSSKSWHYHPHDDHDHTVAMTSEFLLPEPSGKAKGIALVKASFCLLNGQDLEASQDLHTEDVMWYFHDKEGCWVHALRWDDFVEEMRKVFASFPDFTFSYHSVKSGRKSTVVLSNGVASGTHTGKPYGFGPYDAIETTGKFVKNDPEDIKVSFRDGKICRYDVYVRGRMTGFAGLYTQLGGFPLL